LNEINKLKISSIFQVFNFEGINPYSNIENVITEEEIVIPNKDLFLIKITNRKK